MQNEFSSKIYLESKSSNLGLKILLFAVGVIIFGCVFIKIIVGDFQFSDVSGILLTVVLMVLAKNRIPKKFIYGFGRCILNFDTDKMTITYPDIDGGKKNGHFKDITIIRYEDIETIQYGKALECFRIIAACDKKREYFGAGRSRVVQIATVDNAEETFVYVLDEEMQDVVLKNIQKYARFIVNVLED